MGTEKVFSIKCVVCSPVPQKKVMAKIPGIKEIPLIEVTLETKWVKHLTTGQWIPTKLTMESIFMELMMVLRSITDIRGKQW